MTTKTLDLNNIERKIFWFLLSLIGLVTMFGLYSFSSLTFAVIDRDNMNSKNHELMVSSGSLEAEYLARMNSITLEYAKTLGFYEINPKYAGETALKLSMAR